jgi:hypothetical protein
MTKSREHFDQELDSRVSPRFAEDLKVLFKADAEVPPQVDRAVIDQVRRHLVHRTGRRRVFRWAASVAAAAAVVIFAFSLDLTKRPGPTYEQAISAEAGFVDIDENGRVDILDAFKLARHVESAGPAEMQWDVNGDGLVDRGDVDLVAFAAVRLDKGVL